ncbi:uncharacterized protein LOC110729982 [Chenopodium quinoa]|uniref:uncharacterized protein LOC110729982 n=1 Tax=Chenopodium quinoa TaxID=63459 RepID=UPI000B7821C4|nr:uncharacterized protein LOC110729982 [Chenopodium quinoa]
MVGGKKGETSKSRKGKEKRQVLIYDDDEEMEDAEEAEDLGDDEDPQTQMQIEHHEQQLQAQQLQGQHASQSSQRVVLDPATCWFDDKAVVKAISGTLTGYYRKPWRNYGEVDAKTKEHWWNLFCVCHFILTTMYY